MNETTPEATILAASPLAAALRQPPVRGPRPTTEAKSMDVVRAALRARGRTREDPTP